MSSGKDKMFIYDASVKYREEGTPLLIIAGKEYGSGSSRDWAAKGVLLLGVRAVIAESFERIHRSNLVGMGVLPLEFVDGQTRESLGLTGFESFAIEGIPAAVDSCGKSHVRVIAGRKEIRGPRAYRYAGGSRVLPQWRDSAVRTATVGGEVVGLARSEYTTRRSNPSTWLKSSPMSFHRRKGTGRARRRCEDRLAGAFLIEAEWLFLRRRQNRGGRAELY